MKSISRNQQGFIPMIICILLVIAVIIYLAYKQVAGAGV
jgi:hypothetical protein